MKTGQAKRIKLTDSSDNVTLIDAEYIGKGQFCTCYHADGIVYSYLKKSDSPDGIDYSKIAVAEWTEDNIHIPEFKIYGETESHYILTSPLYDNLSPAYTRAWNQFKILQREYDIFLYANYKNYKFGYDLNRAFLNSLTGIVGLSDSIIDGLNSINDACTNYGNFYRFEFAKRNMKVNQDGTLILLDCIFNSHALKSFKNT